MGEPHGRQPARHQGRRAARGGRPRRPDRRAPVGRWRPGPARHVRRALRDPRRRAGGLRATAVGHRAAGRRRRDVRPLGPLGRRPRARHRSGERRVLGARAPTTSISAWWRWPPSGSRSPSRPSTSGIRSPGASATTWSSGSAVSSARNRRRTTGSSSASSCRWVSNASASPSTARRRPDRSSSSTRSPSTTVGTPTDGAGTSTTTCRSRSTPTASSLAASGLGDRDAAARYVERARRFAPEFVHWFAGDGGAVPFGRSLTYRMAQGSFWGALALADVDALDWAEVRGLALRHLRWWSERPISDRDGVVSVGYGYDNRRMGESYNSAGSPYWCMKAFTMLAAPDDHPFWTVAEAAPPPAATVTLRTPGMVLGRRRRPGGRADGAAAGLVVRRAEPRRSTTSSRTRAASASAATSPCTDSEPPIRCWR